MDELTHSAAPSHGAASLEQEDLSPLQTTAGSGATSHRELDGETLPQSQTKPGNWRLDDTDLMRAAAALLICNSHLKQFYPFTWMGGDGLLGNSFFFFLSGFGIALAAHSRNQGFFRWYGRRIGRIYPTVILGVIFLELPIFGEWRGAGPLGYVRLLIWPTPYYFVSTIMVVYVLLYWLLKAKSLALHVACIAAMACVAVGIFAFQVSRMRPHEPLVLGEMVWAHNFYFCAVTLLGALLSPITRRPVKTFWRDVSCLCVIFAIYVAAKFAMDHGHVPQAAPSLHVMVVVMCLLTLRDSAADELHEVFHRFKWLGASVAWLAALTLAIYVVQFYVMSSPTIAHLRRPVNILAFWAITIFGAFLLHKAAGLVLRWLESAAQWFTRRPSVHVH